MRPLIADRALLGRISTAERVARILRDRISEGYFRPGDRLREDRISEALQVSRNTLREAFRLLTHERLLVHRFNRGVFVRVPAIADLRDLYRVRRHLECSALRGADLSAAEIEAIGETVRRGRRAIEERDWRALGTADIQFHQALTALARSDRVDAWMRAVLAELRLVFGAMPSPVGFHEPYLARNEEIFAAIAEGDAERAARLLDKYLNDAERELVAAYTRSRGEPAVTSRGGASSGGGTWSGAEGSGV